LRDAVEASLSPDGARLVFMRPSDQSIWLAKADGSEPVRFQPPGFANEIRTASARFSPDGTKLGVMIAAAKRGATTMDFWVAPLDGGAAKRIPLPSEISDRKSFSWLPDGRHLLVAMRRGDFESHIYQLDLSSGELRALTADLPAGQVRSRAASGAASPAGAARPGHGPRRPRAAIWVTAVIWLAIAAAAHTAAAIPLVLLSLFLLRAASARWADPSIIAVGQAGHPVVRARRCAASGVHRPAGGASCRCLPRARPCPARGHRVIGGRAGRAPGRTLPARRGHDLAGARPWGR